MPSPRLVTWGAIGGVVAGILLVLGYLLALFVASGSEAANITGTWFTALGFIALVFAAIGLHEVLHAVHSPLAGTGAVLTMIGSVMAAAVGYIALGSAYGITDEPLYLATELIGFPAAGGVALMVGLALLGLAILRTEPLPTGAGGALVAAALVAVVAAVTSLVGAPVPALFYVAGLLVGVGAGWGGAALWSIHQRPPADV